MKNTLQVLALILAVGATVQTIKAYAQEVSIFSADEEEYKISQLMQLRRDIEDKETAFVAEEEIYVSEFPEISSKEQVNEALIMHTLKYIKAIGAENTLINILKRPEVARSLGHEPGI